jgi:hypothetical protein
MRAGEWELLLLQYPQFTVCQTSLFSKFYQKESEGEISRLMQACQSDISIVGHPRREPADFSPSWGPL